MIILFLLAACSPAVEELPEDTQPPAATEVLPSEEPYPYPYPEPLVLPSPTIGAYPEPSEEVPGREQIEWEEAKNLILNGEVTEVFQLHSLEVILTLEDGTTVVTIEPNIDDVFDVLEECGEVCADVTVATE
jgi:hypothetical protein